MKEVRVLAAVGTTTSKRVWDTGCPVKHKSGRDIQGQQAQVLELEANSILWAVEFRHLLSEESKKPQYMPLYVCVKAVYW